MRTRAQNPGRRRGGSPDITRLPREVTSELRKVTWPSREEAARLTVMVLLVSTAVGLFLGGVDYVFSALVSRFLLGG